MKKSLCVIALIAGLSAYQAFGQTISLTGSSGTINPGGTFDSTITLTITGNNSIGNVESVNFLLATPSSGANSGAGIFNVFVFSEIAPFNTANGTTSAGNPDFFTTMGDAANTGTSVSATSGGTGSDLGANTTSPVAVAATGTTTMGVDVLRFMAPANIQPGTYNFFVTKGGFNDPGNQGAWIDNSSNAPFDINDQPVFTITVVPEPATWSLVAFGGLVGLGFTLLRGKRRI